MEIAYLIGAVLFTCAACVGAGFVGEQKLAIIGIGVGLLWPIAVPAILVMLALAALYAWGSRLGERAFIRRRR